MEAKETLMRSVHESKCALFCLGATPIEHHHSLVHLYECATKVGNVWFGMAEIAAMPAEIEAWFRSCVEPTELLLDIVLGDGRSGHAMLKGSQQVGDVFQIKFLGWTDLDTPPALDGGDEGEEME